MKLKNINPFIILSFIFVFGCSVFFALADDNFSFQRATFQDSDKDGLSDGEEGVYGTDPKNADSDGDGYSDGVEVKSGYDPLKPAPGDKIGFVSESAVLGESTTDENSDEENMTKELSEKFAQFVNEKKDSEGEVSVEDLDAIIQGSIGDEISEDIGILINEGMIKIKKQDYSTLTAEERTKKENEDAAQYFKDLLYILVSNAPSSISSEEEVGFLFEEFAIQFKSLLEGSSYREYYFSDLGDRAEMIANQIGEIEVPEALLDLHKEGLQVLFQSLELRERVEINHDDQISLIVNLAKVEKVLEQGAVFQENVTAAMDKYGIENGYSLIFAN